MVHDQSIAVIDFGSQYTQLIARRIRELNVFSEILPFSISLDELKVKHVKAIILSGGPSSVYEENAPKISEDMYVLCEKLISGYKIYLEKLEIGIPNKRKICRDIELNHFNNAIVNIRQDYHDYDSYFGGNYDGKSYSEIFSIETKTKLLYNALNFFLREPTKSA